MLLYGVFLFPMLVPYEISRSLFHLFCAVRTARILLVLFGILIY